MNVTDSEIERQFQEQQLISAKIQFDLSKGELNWEDSTVQYFIPVVLYHTDFDWLRLIAEHELIEEDEKIVKNFLDMVETLKEVNSQALHKSVTDKIKNLFED